MFDTSTLKLPQKVSLKKDLSENSEWENFLKSFMNEEDFLCQEIIANHQKYEKGDLVVLAVEDCDHITVGVIQAIVVRKDKVYFVTRNGRASRTWLRYFTTDNVSQVSSFSDCSRLTDYKPLINRGTSEKFVFVLHHHISYDYV